MPANFKQLLNEVKGFVFDVDGVLTDGSLTLMPDGEQVRTMNIRDGYALQLAVKKGYKVGVITGGRSESVRKRLNGLGITDVYLNAQEKTSAFEEFLHLHSLEAGSILYMGDDLPDLAVMKKTGIPACPGDAAPEIRAISIYVSAKNGGSGCVRDVIEQVLRLHGKWEAENS